MSKDTNQLDSENPEMSEFFKKFIEGKGVNDIESVIKNLNLIADSKRKDEYTALYHEFEKQVIAIGFESLRDFMTAIEAQGIIKPARAPRRKVEIRYRDTENPKNTWTARGKKPTWLVNHIENGRKIEEFEVPQPEKTEEKPE